MKRFYGCTPSQLATEDFGTVMADFAILQIERQANAAEQRRLAGGS